MPSTPLVGLWTLISITARAADGTLTPEVYGANPVGYLTYTATGHMMGMFARGDRPRLSGQADSPFSLDSVPIEELAQAFTGFSAYAGTYTLQDKTVHHHLTTASIPNRVGTTLVRTFSLRGDRLTLSTPAITAAGPALVFELEWERLPFALPNIKADSPDLSLSESLPKATVKEHRP